MELDDKAELIESVLGFDLDAPFLETANLFPSPEDVIEDWYLMATAFRNVRDKQKIPEEHWEALLLLLEDAIAEYQAAAMLGEAPAMEEELGVEYDGYDVPDGFAAKHQAAVWQEVLAVMGTDKRKPALKIESE